MGAQFLSCSSTLLDYTHNPDYPFSVHRILLVSNPDFRFMDSWHHSPIKNHKESDYLSCQGPKGLGASVSYVGGNYASGRAQPRQILVRNQTKMLPQWSSGLGQHQQLCALTNLSNASLWLLIQQPEGLCPLAQMHHYRKFKREKM
jgi:hypothetical protein